jgi:hypothetical protein
MEALEPRESERKEEETHTRERIEESCNWGNVQLLLSRAAYLKKEGTK